MLIYILTDEEGYVQGWGSPRSTDQEIEYDIDDFHPFLMGNPSHYRLVDGVLMKDSEIELQRAKEEKDAELNAACNKAILAGFSYTIDDILYWFSYDMEAQGNFRDAKTILEDGLVEVVPWTVRVGGIDGEYTRIPITLDIINAISIVIVQHKTNNIGRYRDILMPIVKSATTIEGVANVQW